MLICDCQLWVRLSPFSAPTWHLAHRLSINIYGMAELYLCPKVNTETWSVPTQRQFDKTTEQTLSFTEGIATHFPAD